MYIQDRNWANESYLRLESKVNFSHKIFIVWRSREKLRGVVQTDSESTHLIMFSNIVTAIPEITEDIKTDKFWNKL